MAFCLRLGSCHTAALVRVTRTNLVSERNVSACCKNKNAVPFGTALHAFIISYLQFLQVHDAPQLQITQLQLSLLYIAWLMVLSVLLFVCVTDFMI